MQKLWHEEPHAVGNNKLDDHCQSGASSSPSNRTSPMYSLCRLPLHTIYPGPFTCTMNSRGEFPFI
ncbi:hypothetical protein Mapa_016104 [Marchantia paleacea]|nr:hypothetical protein Mapa_016104 [Marchantia paleacea]